MKFSIKVTVGDLEQVSSGTVITYTDSNLQITIFDEGPPMNIKFNFISDGYNTKARVNTIEVSSDTMQLEFVNFNNALGLYSTKPQQVGISNNRPLFFSYAVYAVPGSNVKKIDYSFFLGEEVKNG